MENKMANVITRPHCEEAITGRNGGDDSAEGIFSANGCN